jgi:glyoxylase-like metal-dependent hydrolase (beta-lactamase superfamily II)
VAAERIRFQLPWSPTIEKVADGVWLVRGDLGHAMNVYLLEDGDGVTVFDAGTQPMVKAVRQAAEKLGGIKRVVLGHADSDHRGSAPYLGAPVYVHPGELEAARAQGPYRDYWTMDDIDVASSKFLYANWLHKRWDGGPIEVADTVNEGDEIAGFEVKHFPGHAPGLIGLWRASDGVAIVSDAIYLVDSLRLKAQPELELEGVSGHRPCVPHPVWNWDSSVAADSVRKLAALEPRTILPGHELTLEGDPKLLRALLEKAATLPAGTGAATP